jgi:6-phosphogluconolactonase
LTNKVDSKREIILCQDKDDLADKAARTFAALVNKKPDGSLCNIALSGGSTPKLLYEHLLKPELRDTVNWKNSAFYVSDERCVPHESPESNWGNAYRQLLQPLQLNEKQLHPCKLQDVDAQKSAALYEEEIRDHVAGGRDALARFDILFLGMGPDGHTASLFPGTDALNETTKLVTKNHVAKLNADRITFTFPLINAAENVIFLVAGEDKAEVLSQVMAGRGSHPAGSVMPDSGKLIWFVDRAAASKLIL